MSEKQSSAPLLTHPIPHPARNRCHMIDTMTITLNLKALGGGGGRSTVYPLAANCKRTAVFCCVYTKWGHPQWQQHHYKSDSDQWDLSGGRVTLCGYTAAQLTWAEHTLNVPKQCLKWFRAKRSFQMQHLVNIRREVMNQRQIEVNPQVANCKYVKEHCPVHSFH